MSDFALNKVPPHNLEAEQALLGALLVDWNAITEIATSLRDDKFYSFQHQIIYKAMISLAKQNIKGDLLTVKDQLIKDGTLEKAGGIAYIADLTSKVPTSANIDYYAKIISDCADRRNIIKISSELHSASFDETISSTKLIEEAEQKIFSLSQGIEAKKIYGIKDVITDTIELIDERVKNKNEYTGIPSGFAKLDGMTNGFQDSEFIVIGARPSIGKTALALSMIEYISVTKGISCGFFSLEMAHALIGQRLLSQIASISGNKIRSGFLELRDFQRLQDAASKCYESPLYIVDTPNMNLLDIRAMARRLVAKKDVKIIFIDYLGLIDTGSDAPVYEQVAEISKSLKSLARELEIPIVALSQLARDAEGKEPSLSQIRGSGSVEQDADVVIFIHRDRNTEDQDTVQDAKLIVAKQRNGPTGFADIAFIPKYTKFENKTNQ